MIEALEKVNWDRLDARTGRADQFPDWIMQLASEDDAWRLEGQQALWRACSPPCPATAAVVPFLLDLLETDGVRGKDELLHMLGSFATPAPDGDGHSQSEVAARAAVYAGLNTCARFLHSPDPAEREATINLICRFDDEYATVIDLARPCLAAETDAAALVKMIESYAALVNRVGWTPDEGDWLAGFTDPGCPSVVRLHAALLVADWLHADPPSTVVQTLCEAILNPASFAKYPSELLYSPIVENACEQLARLPLTCSLAAFEQVMHYVSDPDDAHSVALRLLDLAFFGVWERVRAGALPDDYPVERPDNQHVHFRMYRSTPEQQAKKRAKGRLYPIVLHPLTAEDLTDTQRRIVTSVLHSESIWSLHSNVFERYGLPMSRAGLRMFVQGV